MTAPAFDLERLLGPIGEAVFFGDYWEKQPLHVERGAADYYEGLLSTADVEEVIAFTRPKFVDSSAFSGEPAREKTFVQGWLADRQLQDGVRYPGIADLRRVYAQGKTVIIMTMQQRWLPIAALCRSLEGVFHCPVHANMYLTPPGAQGFDAHFDTHEVLVLQLEGSKHWRLYESARPLPLVDERFSTPKDQLGPPRDVHLEAGDLLYIPRGHVHEAFTSDCASLHLTVGVNVYRWADLLHEALAGLTRRDERFRGALPPRVLGGGATPAAIEERFRDLLGALAAEARAGDALRHLGDQFFGQLAMIPDAQFAPADDAEAIDLDTALRKKPGALCRVVEDRGWVAIEYPGGQVGGPPKIASALHFVARAGAFRVRDLPDDLGAESKLVLARRLLREGLLCRAGRAAEDGDGEDAGAGSLARAGEGE